MDLGFVCRKVDATLFCCGEEKLEIRSTSLDLLANRHSVPHLWS